MLSVVRARREINQHISVPFKSNKKNIVHGAFRDITTPEKDLLILSITSIDPESNFTNQEDQHSSHNRVDNQFNMASIFNLTDHQ